MDPEPGRCRRTDGKKWRCSRDVVAGQKYCERHMHRGRNRSRKPVEPTTAATGAGAGAGGGHLGSNTNRVSGRALLTAESGNGNYFSLSGQSPSVDLLHLNQRSDFVWAPLKNFVLSRFRFLNCTDYFPQPLTFCLIMLLFNSMSPFFFLNHFYLFEFFFYFCFFR